MSAEDDVNKWIKEAYDLGSSDIHIEPDGDKVRVRLRTDGMCKQHVTSNDARKVISRIKLMADLDVNTRDVPQDGRIKTDRWMQGTPGLDLRMSTLPCMGGEKIVLRLVDNRKLGMTLDELGFTKKMLKLYEPLIGSPNGLVLHVGPTGSGKTTSLYAAIQTIKKNPINIQTVEDPIEYDVFGITQTGVNASNGLTFPAVLRALLRQDPDVILVGEIRDTDTAEIATEAAMTGHLVLSTLHTNDAVGTVVRLLDMGIAPYCIAYALRCVVSQRFVRRLCEKCRRSSQPNQRVIQVTGSPRPIYSATGCARCSKQGYKGRVPLFEFLPNTKGLQKAVYQSLTPNELADVAAKSGLISLWEDGLDKVWQGLTTLEEVLRIAKGVKGGVDKVKVKSRRAKAARGGQAKPRSGASARPSRPGGKAKRPNPARR